MLILLSLTNEKMREKSIFFSSILSSILALKDKHIKSVFLSILSDQKEFKKSA